VISLSLQNINKEISISNQLIIYGTNYQCKLEVICISKRNRRKELTRWFRQL